MVEKYLADEEILDLRAGFYDKFYKPQKPYTTLKFIKEGKVISHWAKAYRGYRSARDLKIRCRYDRGVYEAGNSWIKHKKDTQQGRPYRNYL